MPARPRRKPSKAPLPPLDLEEIEQDPGFRGMLSFLQPPPESASFPRDRKLPEQPVLNQAELHFQRSDQQPMGISPAADSPSGLLPSSFTPKDDSPPVSQSDSSSPSGPVRADLPVSPPIGSTSERHEPVPQRPSLSIEKPVGRWPGGESPSAQYTEGSPPIGLDFLSVTPYIEVEGRGKRPLRYCRTAQDGHTSSEQVAYQALWALARRLGQSEPEGSHLVDVGLARICQLLGSDHKNVKRLLQSLEAKLAIEVVERPDYRLGIPTRYRVFSYVQILERRRRAGMVWVVRTRTTRFVDLGLVRQLIEAEKSAGQQPMGEFFGEPEPPMGRTATQPMGDPPQQPMGNRPEASFIGRLEGIQYQSAPTSGFPAPLARSLSEWIRLDDSAVQRIWNACRKGTPDCTEEEVAEFCRIKQPLLESGRIENPVGLLIRSVPKFFENGGGAALIEYRQEQARARDRERQRLRRSAELILADPDLSAEERAWAEDLLRSV